MHNTVAFYKDPLGVVHLRGVAVCSAGACWLGSVRANLFTQPPGYHPPAQEALPVLTNVGGGLARVDITSNGVVALRNPEVPNGSWVTLDGITFRAA